MHILVIIVLCQSRPLIKAADDMTDASLAPVKWTFALTEEVGIKMKEVFEHLLNGRDEAATWLRPCRAVLLPCPKMIGGGGLPLNISSQMWRPGVQKLQVEFG